MDPVEKPEKQYHSKRPHRKSRTGCRNCKTRKVKCDEARPACRACTLRKEDCLYPGSPTPPPTYTRAVARRRSPSVRAADPAPAPVRLLDEPLYVLGGRDVVDMKLLWFYTTQTFEVFVNPESSPVVSEILRVKVVQHAFRIPFLMHTLLGLTAQHLRHLNQDMSPARATAYRVSAFEGYRKAITLARPETYPALLACSLLLCGVAADHFRDPDVKPLYIIDYMQIWRGVSLIAHLVKAETIQRAGMRELFHRPPINLDASAVHIPNDLLFMVSSIPEDDPDSAHVKTYYDTLKYLGSLYRELANGFSATMSTRVVVFFTFLPADFFVLAREHRPRALVILAYYLAFTRTVGSVWWMIGMSDREIRHIYHYLGEAWYPLLRIPRMAAHMTDRFEIARLLLGDSTWEPAAQASPQPPVWIDNLGNPVPVRFDSELSLRRKQETDAGLQGYVTELVEEEKRYAEDDRASDSSTTPEAEIRPA